MQSSSVILGLLSIALLAGVVRSSATEVEGLLLVFCSADEGVKSKIQTCMADMPERVRDAQTACREEAAPGASEDAAFNEKLCSGDQTVAENMVKCVGKKRTELASQLEDKELRSALKTLLCIRKLGMSLRKE